MNAEKTAIRILSITALLLLAALIFLPKPATGQVSLKDGDFLVATHLAVGGSDVVYVAETRTTGLIAAFMYDPQARGLRPAGPGAVRPITDAFGGR